MIPFIQARNITLVFTPKNREPVTALKDFTLEVGKGEFVSIVGPSGCGKSTFLNILLGLHANRTRGEMELERHAHHRARTGKSHGFPGIRLAALEHRNRERRVGIGTQRRGRSYSARDRAEEADQN